MLMFCRYCGTQLGANKRPAIRMQEYETGYCQGCGELKLVAPASRYKINVMDARRAIEKRIRGERFDEQ